MKKRYEMPAAEEISDEVVASVESDLDAWEGFYKKFKEDYARISEFEKKIVKLQNEIKKRDSILKEKMEKERGGLLLMTVAFIVASGFLLALISTSLNVWLYFTGGVLIGLGGFSLLHLWTR